MRLASLVAGGSEHMQRQMRIEAWWFLAAMSALACALDIDASGRGKACAGNGRCATGYTCSAEGRCIILSSAALDSGIGASGAAGEPDSEGGPQPDGAGAAGNDGAGTTGNDGAGPDMDGQGGLMADAGDAGCVIPIIYFADADGDGVGRSGSARSACTRPAGSWATRDGDCNDSNADAFPGQTRYFEASYATPAGASFDYDCSGSEDPDRSGPGRAPNCSALTLLNCSGSGLAGTGRTGSGVNPICGSAELVQCSPGLLTCDTAVSTSPKGRCR